MCSLVSRAKAQCLDSEWEVSEFGIVYLTFAKRVEFSGSHHKKRRSKGGDVMLINLIVVTNS